MPPKKQTKVTILEDLEVQEVSHVDRAANKRSYLVVKNVGDANMKTNPQNVASESDATSNTTPTEKGEAPTSTPESSSQTPTTNSDSEDALIVGMSSDTKKAFGETLKNVSQRLGALGEAVIAAKTEDGTATPKKLTDEIMAAANTLGQLAMTDKSEVIDALSKGVLYDMQPAQISLDAGGMVMGEQGPMYAIPADLAKPFCCEMARKLIYEVAEMLYETDPDMESVMEKMAKVMKTLGPFLPNSGGAPMQMEMASKQYAFNQPQPSIPAGVPHAQVPAQMSKAGRKISGANMAKLEELFGQLSGLIGTLKQPKEPEPTEKAEKADKTAELEAQVKSLTELAKAQNAELKKLQNKRPTGNAALPDEHTDTNSQTSGHVVWPDDLNTSDDEELRF